jgi:oligopeptide/dipeptide ABC transporter ATP-binding protein
MGSGESPAGTVLRFDGVHVYFRRQQRRFRAGTRRDGLVRAVDDVSLSVLAGQTVGVVGESGSGKSTLGRSAVRLVPLRAGRVWYDARDVAGLRGADLKAFRRRLQIVFQDPYSSLNPRMTVQEILAEPLVVHGVAGHAERTRRIREVVDLVGIAANRLPAFPSEFSGGQRQRIALARALVLRPETIILDEPLSALDVSIQAQIVNLLEDLQTSLSLTYLLIAHDLAMVEHISHRVAVMYHGRIVEEAPTADLYERPRHPYTRLLLDSEPSRTRVGGDAAEPPPNAAFQGYTSGCRFRNRCPLAQEICAHEAPTLTERTPGHSVACHFDF